MSTQLIVTCEHGGNRVPVPYARLFRGHQQVLAGHRGFDRGSLQLARTIASHLGAALVTSTVTRLLVELNRSPHHRALFSEFSAALDESQRRTVLDRFYYPYRNKVQSAVAAITAQGDLAVHVSVHTFTPHWNGHPRTADVGLLYDPKRSTERQFCSDWRAQLQAWRGDVRVRRNYPYLGKADGFTTYLRRHFAAKEYVGIELEVNLRWTRDPTHWKQWSQGIARSLAATLAAWDGS